MGGWKYEESRGTRWGFRVREVLYSERSAFQKIEILDTESFGRVLFLDDVVMLSERGEFAYHEMAAHVPLFVHPHPRSVLIIGGGDGGTAREVLRHGVERVDLVEIDAMVVEACRNFLQCTASSLGDPRLRLTIGDGIEFLRTRENRYELIIVDSTDPAGPAEGLFGKGFYADAAAALSDDGILVAQSESPVLTGDLFAACTRLGRELFPVSLPYLYHTPDYPSGLWSFTFSSKKFHPVSDFNPGRYSAAGFPTRYYNERIHVSAFDLPNFIRDLTRE